MIRYTKDNGWERQYRIEGRGPHDVGFETTTVFIWAKDIQDLFLNKSTRIGVRRSGDYVQSPSGERWTFISDKHWEYRTVSGKVVKWEGVDTTPIV